MARAYIIARRNDLADLNINLADLQPQAGQRNSIYDGAPQNHYLRTFVGVAGATTVDGDTFVSGSPFTALTANAAADDTTGGGNDVTATQVAEFGLAAYIRERVQGGGTVLPTAPAVPFANANTMAANILAAVEAGNDLTLLAINAILTAVVANTDLDGDSATSQSFGSVEDILRILSGEVYRTRAFTIIENVANEFLVPPSRALLVAAQNVGANGGVTFYAEGAFMPEGESGYVPTHQYVRNGALNISNNSGQLAGYKTALAILNPNFAYTAADTTVLRPRARDTAGAAIPTTGLGSLCAVYDASGAVL